jgi:hypothetical protein
MPLRDHFRTPVWNRASWEGFHGGWPMTMVLNLAPKLPKGFAAEPRVHRWTLGRVHSSLVNRCRHCTFG